MAEGRELRRLTRGETPWRAHLFVFRPSGHIPPAFRLPSRGVFLPSCERASGWDPCQPCQIPPRLATPPSAVPMVAWTQAAPAPKPTSGRTRPSRLRPRFATWLMACLTLYCLWILLPLEAPDADDQEGLDEAFLETPVSRSIPHFPLGFTCGTGDPPDTFPERPYLSVEPAPSVDRPHGPTSALAENPLRLEILRAILPQ